MGRPERTLPAATWGWLLVLAVGLGITAASGVVTSGDPVDASTTDVIPSALIGAIVAAGVGLLVIALLRGRPAAESVGAPAALVVFVAGGALIGIALSTNTTTAPTADAETLQESGEVDAGPGRTPAVGAPVSSSDDRDRRDISDFQGSIVLAAGLVLLGSATAFLMRRSELRAVERNAVYLRSELLLEEDEVEPVTDDSAIAGALTKSLDELLNESDPRLAIRAAYGSLLNELAEIGFARHRYEGPAEHIRRCLSEHPLPTEAVNELVQLFEIARFSEHPVTQADADRARQVLSDAIAGLESVPS